MKSDLTSSNASSVPKHSQSIEGWLTIRCLVLWSAQGNPSKNGLAAEQRNRDPLRLKFQIIDEITQTWIRRNDLSLGFSIFLVLNLISACSRIFPYT